MYGVEVTVPIWFCPLEVGANVCNTDYCQILHIRGLGVERDILWIEIPATFHRKHLNAVQSSCCQIRYVLKQVSLDKCLVICLVIVFSDLHSVVTDVLSTGSLSPAQIDCTCVHIGIIYLAKKALFITDVG